MLEWSNSGTTFFGLADNIARMEGEDAASAPAGRAWALEILRDRDLNLLSQLMLTGRRDATPHNDPEPQ
jgi:hypothetical protein